MTYDAVIIGAGPAGLQAALFLARAGLKTGVVGDPAKSDLAYGRRIGNLFGVLGEPPGETLLANSVSALKGYGAEFLKSEALDLKQKEDALFIVKLADGTAVESKTVVIATGVAHAKAGIEDEEAFFGKGVHTCVACDGYFYKGKTVGVVGEGDFAAEEALELLAHTNRISIYSQGKDWTMSPETKRVLESKGVALKDARIVKLTGDPTVTSATLEDGTTVPLDGIFVALGTTSSLAFAQKLGLEQTGGFIAIDRDGKTNVEGVYAAGGCTGGNQQIAKSAGEGCNAAISIIKKLRGVADFSDQT